MSPLRLLILERMRERGWDAKAVEGRGVSHATLHRYMNPLVMKTLPRPSVLEALARGLELDIDVVRAAAFASLEGSPSSVGRPGQDAGYVARGSGPSITDATLDELLAEVARRAREGNPDAR